MTLAVPGSTGFVALAQRAVIGTIDRARSGLRDVRRWWSGAAEPGSECVSDDFAGVGVVGVGACFEGLLEIWVDPDGDDAGGCGADRPAAALAAQGRGVVAGFGFVGEVLDGLVGDGGAAGGPVVDVVSHRRRFLSGHGRRSRYCGRAFMAWMASSVPSSRSRTNDLEEPTSGVEAEAELPGWLVVVDGVGDEVLLGGGVDVVVADPVFAGRAVNFHPAIVIRNTAVGPVSNGPT